MHKLFSSAGIYTLGNLANAAIPFFLLPVLTRYLNAEDYGTVAMFQVLTGITLPFVGLTMQGALARRFYDTEQAAFRGYVANALFLLSLSVAVTSVFFALFARPISAVTGFPVTHLWTVIVFAAGQTLILFAVTLWQVRVKPLPYVSFLIAKTLLDAGLSISFVVAMNMGWQGRVQGQVIAVSFFGLLGLFFLWRGRWLSWRIRSAPIRRLLRFGVPLIPHALGMWAIQMTDRLLITNLIGLAETGIYFVGVQVGMVILILQDSFNRAWVPHFYSRLKRADPLEDLTIVRITYAYDLIILALALLLGWLAPFVLSFLVGETYRTAAPYIRWIALGYAFNGMYKMVANYMFYNETTRLLAWLTFATAAANLLFSYGLIRWQGAVGAAQGTALAFFISLVATWTLAARLHKMPWRRAFRFSEREA